jgi:bifunctional UDP-N-acetylglucosamine pyrophosphorylase/glucosamine-1-phosphate N-acetyltransferase
MIVFIMAGGLGKRMDSGSDLPKVCHQVKCFIDNKFYPMIVHVILTALGIDAKAIYVIVGKSKLVIEQLISKYLTPEQFRLIHWIHQEEPLGTGHAILCGLPELKAHPNTPTIILSGDVPLITTYTLEELLGTGTTNKLLITELDEPTGCGRIRLNNLGDSDQVVKIIEEKDCEPEEREIKLVNCGIYQINSDDLVNLLPKITSANKSNEYYLTDIIGLMQEANIPVEYYCLPKDQQYEIKNVNTKKDLEKLNELMEIKSKFLI